MSISKTDRPTLWLLLFMWGGWVANIGLYFEAPVPLPIHVLISAAMIHLAFTIWHEAAHRNVSPSRALNDAVGIIGMFPYMTPFFLQRHVHLEHHSHLNTAQDPNLLYTSGSFPGIVLRYPRALGYARRILESDPRSAGQRRLDLAVLSLIGAIYLVGLWQGFFLDLVWLWLLPAVIAKVVMDWYVNYLPHAGLPPDRYLGTRIVDAAWLTPLLLGHNYHAIHHLWPRIPWHRYHARFLEKLEDLTQHGVPIEHSPFRWRREGAPGEASGAR